MGCEALPIEYYESLDSEKRLFGTKPLHKKTPIGDFSNIATLCLRYFNPINGKWLSRDPIAEKGGLNLYAFVGNDGVNGVDYLGMASVGDTRCVTTGTLFEEENCGNLAVTRQVSFSYSGWGLGYSDSTSVNIDGCKKVTVTASYSQKYVKVHISSGVPGGQGMDVYGWVFETFWGFNATESSASCQ
jgi:hypothetical protein